MPDEGVFTIRIEEGPHAPLPEEPPSQARAAGEARPQSSRQEGPRTQAGTRQGPQPSSKPGSRENPDLDAAMGTGKPPPGAALQTTKAPGTGLQRSVIEADWRYVGDINKPPPIRTATGGGAGGGSVGGGPPTTSFAAASAAAGNIPQPSSAMSQLGTAAKTAGGALGGMAGAAGVVVEALKKVVAVANSMVDLAVMNVQMTANIQATNIATRDNVQVRAQESKQIARNVEAFDIFNTGLGKLATSWLRYSSAIDEAFVKVMGERMKQSAEFAKFNQQTAEAMAKAQVGEITRTQEMAKRLGPQSAELIEAQNRLRQVSAQNALIRQMEDDRKLLQKAKEEIIKTQEDTQKKINELNIEENARFVYAIQAAAKESREAAAKEMEKHRAILHQIAENTKPLKEQHLQSINDLLNNVKIPEYPGDVNREKAAKQRHVQEKMAIPALQNIMRGP